MKNITVKELLLKVPCDILSIMVGHFQDREKDRVRNSDVEYAFCVGEVLGNLRPGRYYSSEGSNDGGLEDALLEIVSDVKMERESDEDDWQQTFQRMHKTAFWRKQNKPRVDEKKE